jgi:hypothetical protein
VDLLAVRRGRVGEEDDGFLRGHGGFFDDVVLLVWGTGVKEIEQLRRRSTYM